jgi:hypothetical protein
LYDVAPADPRGGLEPDNHQNKEIYANIDWEKTCEWGMERGDYVTFSSPFHLHPGINTIKGVISLSLLYN